MLENYERIAEIGKGKFTIEAWDIWGGIKPQRARHFSLVKHIQIFAVFTIGSFGKVSKIKRVSDGRILVWKELDYGKMNDKEK